MYIGGSAAGKKMPSDPKPFQGWSEIHRIGPNDLNLKAFYKPYESYSAPKVFDVTDGKSTFLSIVALRGVNMRDPVIDSDAEKDVMPGRDGAARAPSVNTEENGLVLASYVYDDPQVANIEPRHNFDMLLTTDTKSGDGMAIGVSKSTRAGKSGTIYAEGEWASGGGNEIGMAVSFRRADDKPAPRPISVESSGTNMSCLLKACSSSSSFLLEEYSLLALSGTTVDGKVLSGVPVFHTNLPSGATT